MRLRYTRPALSDLASILDYIEERSPQGAAHTQARIQAVIGLLPRYPLIGAPTDDPTIRRVIATPYPYVILYEVGDDEVIVHTVRHSARRPAEPPR